MSHKKLILISFIIFILLITLFVLLTLVPGASNPNNIITSPLSYTKPDNVITISQNKYVSFKYAVITDDDTVELRNEAGEKFIIGLDHRQWKNIQWSPDNSLIALLGKDDFNQFDLYIYNINKESWFKATNYEKFNSGVESYIWKDNQSLVFIQGENQERWLNRFNYLSQSEILKLNRVLRGGISSISNDKKYLLIQDNQQFNLLDIAGNIITNFNNVLDEKNNKLNVSNVILNQSDSKVFLQTLGGDLYKLELGSNHAIDLSLSNKFTGVCAINEDVFLGYNYSKDMKILSVLTLNIKETSLSEISTLKLNDLDTINYQKTICYDNNNLLLNLKSIKNSKFVWYRIKDKNLEEVFVFKNMNEVSIRNIQ